VSRGTIALIASATMAAILLAGNVGASNGTGTDSFCSRHGCGEATDPGLVTECPTTTCPDVTCQATDCSKTTVVVNPTPCPAPAPVVFPDYVPCRKNNDGTRTCPRKRTPRRVLTPVTE
jgi:hypothetical protein